MSRSRRFMGGMIMTYGYQALLMVTGLWLTPFLLGRIGQHDYGLWLVGNQLLLYLTLADFGIVALLPIEAAQATGRGGGVENAQDLPHIVGETTRLVLYQLPVVGLIALAMWLTIPAEWYGLRWPLAIALGGYVVCFPLRMLPALLHGLQDLTFVNAMQMASWAINTSVIVLLVLAGWNLFALAVAWTVSQLLLAPVFAYRLWNRFPQVVPRRIPSLAWESTKAHLGKGFWVSVAQVAQLLMSNTDLLVIGRVLGPAAVVPYSCTGKLAGVVGNQVSILMQNAGPGLVELRAAESRHRIFNALSALSQGILTFSGLIFCVVLLVNHWFVNWWVTAHQYGGFFLTLLFLVALVVRHWTGISSNTVFYFGHQRRISLTNLADGLVTVGTTILLVRLFGVAGAVIGTIAGACLVSLPFNLWVIARDTEVNVISLVSGMAGSWFWRFAVVAGVVGAVASRWSPNNLVEAVAAVAVVTIFYLAMMMPNLMRAPLSGYIRPFWDSFRGKYAALQVRVSS
jgi:O-antigen/teichoic acid export membrane protein